MRSLLPIAVLLALMAPAPANAGSQDAGDKCPVGSTGRIFDGLLICIPQGRERYRLTQDGLDWMAWQGEDPIPFTAGQESAPGDALQMTLARVWLGEVAVGMADKAAGSQGFDHFMSVLAGSIQDGAQRSASSDAFAADVPMDESGQTQRFQFKRIESDLLQGQPDKADLGVDFVLFRPSSGRERPHLLLCSGGTGVESPTHMCMSMREVDGHRMGIMITGTKLERSFRIAEEIASDVESFVIRAVP